MSRCRVYRLSPAALVFDDAQAHPELYEWREPPQTAAGVLDAAGMRDLLVRCANCGMAVHAAEEQELLDCPDCGEEEFEVLQLFTREVVEVRGISFRLTGRGEHRFLHIEIPAAWRQAEARYTADGSEPTQKSHLYRHPVAVGSGYCVVKLVLYTAKQKSRTVSFAVPSVSGYRFRCPVCGTDVSSPDPVCRCSLCGLTRRYGADGSIHDEAPPLTCSCGKVLNGAQTPARCAACGAVYVYNVHDCRWVNDRPTDGGNARRYRGRRGGSGSEVRVPWWLILLVMLVLLRLWLLGYS